MTSRHHPRLPSVKHPVRVFAVDPRRLVLGVWDRVGERRIGAGDIVASHSADRIALSGRIRKPFVWHDGLWVCTGIFGTRECVIADAYELVSLHLFAGDIVSHSTRLADWATRSDPFGCYHRVRIEYAGHHFVLRGPKVRLIPGLSGQRELFALRDPEGRRDR